MVTRFSKINSAINHRRKGSLVLCLHQFSSTCPGWLIRQKVPHRQGEQLRKHCGVISTRQQFVTKHGMTVDGIIVSCMRRLLYFSFEFDLETRPERRFFYTSITVHRYYNDG